MTFSQRVHRDDAKDAALLIWCVTAFCAVPCSLFEEPVGHGFVYHR